VIPYPSLSNVALELIKTNNSNSEYVNFEKNTALIIACQNKLEDIALELIKRGNANSEYIDRYYKNALIYACDNKLISIANLLNK
jgi:ankyrin repeat protein